MSLKDKLTEDMKQAMKDKEAGNLGLSVIRMVRAAIKNVEIDTKAELAEEDVIAIVAKEVKMRRDSMEEFKKGQRDDLVAQLEQEIEVLLPYLPQQLTEAEVREIVTEAVAIAGATSSKDMGKVMAVLMPKVKGRADGKLVNNIVRELLNQ